jgi:hypothetical protein
VSFADNQTDRVTTDARFARFFQRCQPLGFPHFTPVKVVPAASTPRNHSASPSLLAASILGAPSAL